VLQEFALKELKTRGPILPKLLEGFGTPRARDTEYPCYKFTKFISCFVS